MKKHNFLINILCLSTFSLLSLPTVAAEIQDIGVLPAGQTLDDAFDAFAEFSRSESEDDGDEERGRERQRNKAPRNVGTGFEPASPKQTGGAAAAPLQEGVDDLAHSGSAFTAPSAESNAELAAASAPASPRRAEGAAAAPAPQEDLTFSFGIFGSAEDRADFQAPTQETQQGAEEESGRGGSAGGAEDDQQLAAIDCRIEELTGEAQTVSAEVDAGVEAGDPGAIRQTEEINAVAEQVLAELRAELAEEQRAATAEAQQEPEAGELGAGSDLSPGAQQVPATEDPALTHQAGEITVAIESPLEAERAELAQDQLSSVASTPTSSRSEHHDAIAAGGRGHGFGRAAEGGGGATAPSGSGFGRAAEGGGGTTAPSGSGFGPTFTRASVASWGGSRAHHAGAATQQQAFTEPGGRVFGRTATSTPVGSWGSDLRLQGGTAAGGGGGFGAADQDAANPILTEPDWLTEDPNLDFAPGGGASGAGGGGGFGEERPFTEADLEREDEEFLARLQSLSVEGDKQEIARIHQKLIDESNSLISAISLKLEPIDQSINTKNFRIVLHAHAFLDIRQQFSLADGRKNRARAILNLLQQSGSGEFEDKSAEQEKVIANLEKLRKTIRNSEDKHKSLIKIMLHLQSAARIRKQIDSVKDQESVDYYQSQMRKIFAAEAQGEIESRYLDKLISNNSHNPEDDQAILAQVKEQYADELFALTNADLTGVQDPSVLIRQAEIACKYATAITYMPDSRARREQVLAFAERIIDDIYNRDKIALRAILSGGGIPGGGSIPLSEAEIKSSIEKYNSQAGEKISSVVSFITSGLQNKLSAISASAAAGSDIALRHGVVLNVLGGMANNTSKKYDNKSNFIGGAIGYEIANENKTFGAAINLIQHGAKYQNIASKSNIYVGSIYGILDLDKVFLGISAFGGKSFAKEKNDNAFDANLYGANLILGGKFHYGKHKLMPFVGASYARMDRVNKTKQDKDLGDRIAQDLKLSINFKHSYDFQTQSGIVTPSVTFGLAGDVLYSPDVKLVVSANQAPYDIKLANKVKVVGFVAPGIAIQNDMLKLSASVRLEKGRNYFAGMGSLNLALKF